MCGIAGYIDLRRHSTEETLRATARTMAGTLKHRGPDSEGVWIDASAGIALGHRRLAIVDLSLAGNQPMISASQRFVIVYNGELYNSQELRERLQEPSKYPVTFRGYSDTETMLACFDRWGVSASLPQFNGMFAFAAWDRQERTLHLGRDRMGEKPLYYGWVGSNFLFGSELKALSVHPEFRPEINRNALMLFMRRNCVPAPHSIYEGIYKLPPGQILSLPFEHRSGVSPVSYWTLEEAVIRGQRSSFPGTANEATDELDHLLRDAVRIRMVADVPLGGFLSGGVDSSTVVALMQAQSTRPVKTFTIGFREGEYDESTNAALVARHLGTEHNTLYVTSEDALSVIPRLPTIYDEPFADSSQIPTFLVSQLARQYVTVGLSGDGGDELLGGYNRHVWSELIWNAASHAPLRARHFLSDFVRGVAPQTWDNLAGIGDIFLPSKMKQKNVGVKIHKIAEILASKNRESWYEKQTSHWVDPAEVVISEKAENDIPGPRNLPSLLPDFRERMMFLDAVHYLPDDILTKVDRASMASSLEARVPLLDHRVVEYAWSLPLSLRIRRLKGKWLLRRVLSRYVPEKLTDRPKAGFAVPLDTWLRGPLRDWAEALLDKNRLDREGFFHPRPLRELWSAHLQGKGAGQFRLWDVLMFQAWFEAISQKASVSFSTATAVS